MSVLVSFQQLLDEGRVSPSHLRLSPFQLTTRPLSRPTSTFPDFHQPLVKEAPNSAPLYTRVLPPILPTHVPGFGPFYGARCVLLLTWLCIVHVTALIAVFFVLYQCSQSSSFSPSSFTALSVPLRQGPEYSAPMSLLAVSQKRKGGAEQVVPPQSFFSFLASDAEAAADTSPLPEVIGAVKSPKSLSSSISVQSVVSEVQKRGCSASSSPSFPPPLLVYSCAANSLQVEHSDEVYGGRHLGGVYSLARALLFSVATHRTLVLDRSGCAAVPSLNDSTARDTGLVCCEWDQYFLPLVDCEVPFSTLQSAVTTVSPFSVAPVVAFDVRQQCLWTDQTWHNLRGMFPDQTQKSVMQAVTSFLLRPSSSMSQHLSELKKEWDVPQESSLALHVAPFTPELDSAQQLTSRYLPLPTYLSYIRHHAATSPAANSALLLWTVDADLTPYQEALPHLKVVSVYALASTYFATQTVGSFHPLIGTILLLAERSTELVGLHASAATQLVQLAAANPLRVWDVSGDAWTPSCWSSVSHYLAAHHAYPVPYYNPAMTFVLTSSSLVTPPLLPPVQLILVMGSVHSGVDELIHFLTTLPNTETYEDLSTLWTQLFVARASVDQYEISRGQFIRRLRQVVLSTQGHRRVLLRYNMPSTVPGVDMSLENHHHASFLASLINRSDLPVALKVVVMTRTPEDVYRLAAWHDQVPRGQREGQTSGLVNGKAVRDVMAAIEAECEAMDVSVYRTFDTERFWNPATREMEATRLAFFLHFDDLSFLLGRLVDFIDDRSAAAVYDKPHEPRHKEDNDAVRELMAYTQTMQIRNLAHPAYQPDTFDYHRLLKVAMKLRMPQRNVSLAEQVEALQMTQHCTDQQRVLLFNGFTRWTPNTTAAQQLMDLIRALTVALSSGRMLVVPNIPGSVTDFIAPLSMCGVEKYGQVMVNKTAAGWIAGGLTFGDVGDAISEETVAISHSQVIDVAYLAVFNANRKATQRLSVYDFVSTIVRFVIRSGGRNPPQATRTAADLTVIVPVVHHKPLSFYSDAINGWLETQGLGTGRVVVTWADDTFQHVTGPTFLSLLDIDGSADTIGVLMTNRIVLDLHSRWPNLTVDVLIPGTDACEAELLLLSQSKQHRAAMGSLGTEFGLLIASLVPYVSWLDFFAEQYIPAVLALNNRLLRHAYPPSATVVPRAGDPTTVAPVVTKAVYSQKIRFAFVAGLEGTGHHGVGHLLQGMRLFSDMGVWYTHLQVDEWLNIFQWKLLKEVNIIAWDRYRHQLLQRIKWLLEQHQAVSDWPPVYVINTLQECLGGMLSYPNTDLQEKSTLHPSLVTIARMMEGVNADFRVVVLARTPGSSIASAVRRDHAVSLVGKANAFFYLTRVARANLAVLNADVAALDPSFTLTLATESIQTQPELVARGLAHHLGIRPAELIQSALRMREEVVVQPSNHWMSTMTRSEILLTQDVLDISSYLPISNQFAFSVGLIGGRDESHLHVDLKPTGRCRTRPMGLRDVAKGMVVVTMNGAGSDYLREIIEDSTAVVASSHVTDGMLPPSTARYLKDFTSFNLTAFELLQYSVDRTVNEGLFPGAASRVIPTLILTRNPLDIALQVAFQKMMHDVVAVSDEKTWDFSRDQFNHWRREHVGELVALMRGIFEQVGDAYVQWAREWKVAERRQQMLEAGVSEDGVHILRMEDMLAAPSQTLTELLTLFQLPAERSAVECVQKAAESMQFSIRIASQLSSQVISAKRTASNHPLLNASVSSLQYALATSSYPDHATASRPFRILQLIQPEVFKAFRGVVDATASSIEGPDWASYADEVQGLISAYATSPPQAPQSPKLPASLDSNSFGLQGAHAGINGGRHTVNDMVEEARIRIRLAGGAASRDIQQRSGSQ